MKNTNTFKFLQNTFFFIFLTLSLASCSSFPKAVGLIKQGEVKKAEPLFQRSQNHRIYGPGARFYLERIKINQNPNTLAWLEINKTFCQLEEEVGQLPVRQIVKLSRYDASRPDIVKARENLQKRIVEQMSIYGTVPELVALEADPACWPEGAVDTVRAIVVNKNINLNQEVYATEADKKWKGVPAVLPTEEQIRTEKGRPCLALGAEAGRSLNYTDATTISERYADAVLPANYSKFWQIRQNIWRLFQEYHSYCEMDRFKAEHPDNNMAQDCWFDNAQDTLCLGQLRPLLAFHRNNPHTGLDRYICLQILCLYNFAEDADGLNPAERKQVEDIELMFEIQHQLVACEQRFDSTELIAKIVYLANKYQYHELVFELAVKAADHFAGNGRLALAREALEAFRPLFPDTAVCTPALYFQERKQEWFDGFASQLSRAGEKMVLPEPAAAWNTDSHDEYALVSWGETDEVFFVRQNREDGTAKVMTSKRKGQAWTKPAPVAELSVSDDVVPLSISSNGRLLLLRSQGELKYAHRPDANRPWFEPVAMSVPGRFAGNAWISPDDSLLLMEYYVTPTSALAEPKKDLAAARLGSDGKYGNAIPLSEVVNLPRSSEGNPGMALGGRLLFFTSDRLDGLGGKDMYSVKLTKPRDWETMAEPLNLGLQLNTVYEDHGLTYFSEYTGMAYFHRTRECSDDMDIWRLKLGAEVFPENAMRLAGLVVDENGKAIGGGFMEFTPDYQLDVHSQPISSKGTYTYTVPDSTEVVRLFPEIPGYYSERDTTHFLANVAKGEIIRDTFVLTSFDYIRRNYRLVHSTFFNGTAQFDNPNKAYPELTRLARIATRMGAELHLEGHTDGSGLESGNQELSLQRARSVKQFLVEKCGFGPDKIFVYGYGESRPICSNDTEEGRRCNRRVEVVFKMPVLEGKRASARE